jgi:hypothetical protein
MRRALLLAALVLPLGCFVSPTDDADTVRLSLAVAVPHSQTFAAGGFSPWDTQDRFHLDTFPKYVRVAAVPEGQDYDQAYATWPDPQLGIGSAGEGASGEVGIDLDLPPGSYRLHVLGFVVGGEQVTVYGEQQSPTLSLVAGKILDLDLVTRQLETGTLAISVRCQQGNYGEWQPDRLMLWDARAAVLFPAQTLYQTTTGALEVELPGVPVEREFWIRFILKSQLTGDETAVEVRKLFGLEKAGERLPVSFVIPCGG